MGQQQRMQRRRGETGDQELAGCPAPWDNLDGSPAFKTSILSVRRLPDFMVPFKQRVGHD